MKLSLFDYNLPENLIAQYPPEQRGTSRMLVYDRKQDKTEHKHIIDFIDYLNQGDVLVLNNTKVLNARLRGTKQTGAKVEVLLLCEIESGIWECLLKPGSKFKTGAVIFFDKEYSAVIIDILSDGKRVLKFSQKKVLKILDQIGEAPLPPYIKRDEKQEIDFLRYQTVYSEKYGAVAAPTAGLHFTEEILNQIENKGIEIVYVTLHVGLGTFKPVETENIKDHKMHSEQFELTEDNACKINLAKKNNKKIIAVGTTSVRVLESCADNTGCVIAKHGETDIFIYPSYEFKVIDSLLTNFHLPESTLLMLVSAFLSREKVLELYEEAVKEQYRFFSYGDCMFIS